MPGAIAGFQLPGGEKGKGLLFNFRHKRQSMLTIISHVQLYINQRLHLSDCQFPEGLQQSYNELNISLSSSAFSKRPVWMRLTIPLASMKNVMGMLLRP